MSLAQDWIKLYDVAREAGQYEEVVSLNGSLTRPPILTDDAANYLRDLFSAKAGGTGMTGYSIPRPDGDIVSARRAAEIWEACRGIAIAVDASADVPSTEGFLAAFRAFYETYRFPEQSDELTKEAVLEGARQAGKAVVDVAAAAAEAAGRAALDRPVGTFGVLAVIVGIGFLLYLAR